MGGNYSNSGLQVKKGIPGGMKRTKSKYKEKESFKIIFKKKLQCYNMLILNNPDLV